ncbi:HV335 protein, partial [Urocolius indicus]|nr:HV335 protein [Urocolius indicus]
MAAGPGPWLLALALAVGPAGVCAQLRLLEAGGGLRAPGDSVLLSCRGHGYRFELFGVRWYRHAPGRALQWVSYFNFSGREKKYRASVKGRATVSRENSRSRASLFLSTLHAQDSARYLCATHTGTGNSAQL